MPSRAEILTNATNLKDRSSFDVPLSESEGWREKQHGARFHLIKPESAYEIVEGGTRSSLMLAISGRRRGRSEIERDFVGVFGKPKTVFYREFPRKPLILFWRTEKAINHAKVAAEDK